MKPDDRFRKHKNTDTGSWQETETHQDHAAGEYEPLSTNHNEQRLRIVAERLDTDKET